MTSEGAHRVRVGLAAIVIGAALGLYAAKVFAGGGWNYERYNDEAVIKRVGVEVSVFFDEYCNLWGMYFEEGYDGTHANETDVDIDMKVDNKTRWTMSGIGEISEGSMTFIWRYPEHTFNTEMKRGTVLRIDWSDVGGEVESYPLYGYTAAFDMMVMASDCKAI